ncbi:hypothetical protein [Paenibacillus sp. GYB003]|uniref:hypothetical protein n=1 Tax=Paenibacillus sp. GYB003 TaxID=2994392 RepID=UPI002F96E880
MIHNRLFHKIALSTVLLSAVAGPTAFAETTEPQAVGSGASIVRFAAVSALDPLKLAETYAPETAAEWKQTLELYEQAMSAKFQVLDGIDGALRKTVAIGPAIPPEGSAERIAAVSIKLEEANAEGGLAVVTEAMPLSDTAAPAIKEVAWASVVAKDGAPEAVPDEAAKLVVSAAGGDSPKTAFMEGWRELDEAVRSKNGDAIKQSLAKQLTLYKQEIAALNESGSGDPHAADIIQAVPATAPQAPQPDNG